MRRTASPRRAAPAAAPRAREQIQERGLEQQPEDTAAEERGAEGRAAAALVGREGRRFSLPRDEHPAERLGGHHPAAHALVDPLGRRGMRQEPGFADDDAPRGRQALDAIRGGDGMPLPPADRSRVREPWRVVRIQEALEQRPGVLAPVRIFVRDADVHAAVAFGEEPAVKREHRRVEDHLHVVIAERHPFPPSHDGLGQLAWTPRGDQRAVRPACDHGDARAHLATLAGDNARHPPSIFEQLRRREMRHEPDAGVKRAAQDQVVERPALTDDRVEPCPAGELDLAPPRRHQAEPGDRIGRSADLLPHPELAEDLDPLGGNTAPTGFVARERMFVEEHDVGHAELPEMRGRGGSRGTGTDDGDFGFDALAHDRVSLPAANPGGAASNQANSSKASARARRDRRPVRPSQDA
jgi:hypothetical protein